MSEDLTPQLADENLQKFFQNLLDLKEYVKSTNDVYPDPILEKIYQELHRIIKEKE